LGLSGGGQKTLRAEVDLVLARRKAIDAEDSAGIGRARRGLLAVGARRCDAAAGQRSPVLVPNLTGERARRGRDFWRGLARFGLRRREADAEDCGQTDYESDDRKTVHDFHEALNTAAMLTQASLQLKEFAEALGLRAGNGDFGLAFVVHLEHVARFEPRNHFLDVIDVDEVGA